MNASDRQEEAHNAMTAFFEGYMNEHEGEVFLFEFGMFMYVLLWRMRQTMLFEELGRYMIGLLNTTEEAIRFGKDELGGELVLAEDWRGIEGGAEMLQALRASVSEEELTIPDWLMEEE